MSKPLVKSQSKQETVASIIFFNLPCDIKMVPGHQNQHDVWSSKHIIIMQSFKGLI